MANAFLGRKPGLHTHEIWPEFLCGSNPRSHKKSAAEENQTLKHQYRA